MLESILIMATEAVVLSVPFWALPEPFYELPRLARTPSPGMNGIDHEVEVSGGADALSQAALGPPPPEIGSGKELSNHPATRV